MAMVHEQNAAGVVILASLDTKREEVAYLRELIRSQGFPTLIVDLSTRGEPCADADFCAADVIGRLGLTFAALSAMPRDQALDHMTRASVDLTESLYRSGRLAAVLGIGGLQNTLMATAAMKALPLGIPKVMLSTVASGHRTFGQFIGASDVVMVPSIADLAGRNPITDRALKNAAGMVCGMMRLGSGPIEPPSGMLIGATVMGATSDGIMPAVQALRRHGLAVACFHTTGSGGPAMESLVEEGVIRGVLDLCLHEVVSEHFNVGFSIGSANRLARVVQSGLPVVVAPCGADFIDVDREGFLADRILGDHRLRQYVLHNSQIAHVRLLPDETAVIARLLVERLNQSAGPLSIVVPLRGFRSFTRPGEPLHNPASDRIMVEQLRNGLKPGIRLIEVDCNINDNAFAMTAADELIRMIRETDGGQP